MNSKHQSFIFGNRTIACAFPLANLLPTPEAAVASPRIFAPTTVSRLTERNEWSQQWPDKNGNHLLRLAITESDSDAEDERRGYLIQFFGLCEFRLDPSRGSITIAKLPATGTDAIEHLLIDHVLPSFLATLGELVIHASCVNLGTGCVLFLGQSGWGKSTISSLLLRQGHEPLSDDCVLLSICDGQVHATPTYPSLRLFDDSVEQTFERIPTLYNVADYTRKRRIRINAPTSQSVPVRALYLLNDPAESVNAVSIDSIPPIAACMALIKHGFRLDMCSRRRNATFMHQTAMTARHITAFRLSYPRNFARAGHLVEELTKHFGTHHSLDTGTNIGESGQRALEVPI